MKTKSLILFISIVSILVLNSFKGRAHCEIPCGIYEDSLRIELIYEHITTIEKSMQQIIDLSADSNINYNQLVRWITNKEEHAEKIQNIISQYFLNQRIMITEPSKVEAYAKYTNQLALLHQMVVYAMKTKQTTDLEYVQKLRNTIGQFSDSYFHTHTH